MTVPTPIVVSSASWRVRDAADSLLARRGLRSTSLLEGKDEDDNSIPEMTISKYFDVETCQARLRRDKTPIVRMALDAAASAILENLHKADDDEGESEKATPAFENNSIKKMLPSLLEDIEKLQEMRVESMERAHANKDLGKRRIAVAKEQEKLRKLQDKTQEVANPKTGKVTQTAGATSGNPNSKTMPQISQTKVTIEDNSTDGAKVVSSTAKDSTKTGAVTSNDAGTPIKVEAGSNVGGKSAPGTTTKKAPPAPPKFTRNTPASSASALEARLTGSRAILCTAANVAFDSLTPALREWEVIDVADVPQNPAANKKAIKSEGENSTASENVKIEEGKTATVPNMGPVIIEAQMLGKRIENVATNAVRRSKRRFRFRKDNIRFGNKSKRNKKDVGFRILENPFAWKDSDDEDPMDVDESASIVTADSISGMDHSDISETWGKVCIPRLLSILQTGVGNAILHDVMWSTRHCRIANLLHEISLMTEDNNKNIDKMNSSTDRNYGPHLIVTVEPDVDKFAKEFKAPNSHLRLMSTVDESSLRALAYKGTKNERRRLRRQFPHATGLQDASFHVILVSYADFLTDYVHFCQTPFEVVILDDGVSWMAAAHNDPNSPIATVWEDALFSKNDHQMGLAGTTLKDWDYSADTIDEETLKDVWIGLTARHRLVTSSKLRVENPRSPADLLPVPGLLSFALPHFSDAVKEEWDRSRIGNDASSMSHFRKLLTRSMVVHDPNSSGIAVIKAEEVEPLPSFQNDGINNLAMKALKGDMPESIRSKDFPVVPEEISDDRFIDDGKVASSRRSALQWLGSLEDSWLRYELGTVSFQHILGAMKTSLNYGHICEEITTASSVATGATGQIIGNLAFKLGVRSGKAFSSEQGLRQHLSTHHAPPGTWLCRTCKVDCITSQARTHHERSCGQPSSAGGSGNSASASSAAGASKKDAGKKKGKASKGGSGGSAGTKEEKDPDGSVRVPSYRGVWVDQAGKYFIKIESERVCGKDGKKPLTFESIEEAAKKYDALVKKKDEGNEKKIEYNFKSDGTRIVYEDVSTSTTTGLGGGVVPALSVINIKDLPPDVKPLLRDPRQTSRTGGNSKRHVYAYRGVCRQARKGHDRWQSQISFLGVNHYLGTFDSEWDAAAIYAWAHLILYGEEATRKAQKEGEEAAAAYEQEKKDIAAGKIPAAPPKPDKKATPASKKKTEGKSPGDAKKGKKAVKKEEKRKPGRPKKKAEEALAKQSPGKKSKTAGGKEENTPVVSQSVARASILAPVPKFAAMNDDQLVKEAAARMVAARLVNYCVTEVSLPAPIHMDFRPCVPLKEELEEQMGGGALLVGINPSLFGWSIDSIVSKQYFGSDNERRKATEALTEEFGEDGLNQHFQSLVQGSTTVIGCASSRMKRVYSLLGMGSPPIGGPIGPIDCNTGGNSKCCSETAACIRFVPTETGDFQLSALSSDLITMNGQRITPEMGSFPLFNEDICTIGSRVFLFLLPVDT